MKEGEIAKQFPGVLTLSPSTQSYSLSLSIIHIYMNISSERE